MGGTAQSDIPLQKATIIKTIIKASTRQRAQKQMQMHTRLAPGMQACHPSEERRLTDKGATCRSRKQVRPVSHLGPRVETNPVGIKHLSF